jgi:hypothetical protein
VWAFRGSSIREPGAGQHEVEVDSTQIATSLELDRHGPDAMPDLLQFLGNVLPA